ncbi:hypothetical protein [Rhodococcus sp. 11-3]|uniref:hypothetical protein n=1 Tax=Rhodococcus sp. 11-3 TaxID=2854796 RepID=UPI002041D05A|nr:hypothetical protein [Rhodococcus sp. 11-3]USC17058.1 hypothetical protein KZJ41_09400 [Rhodococcus sp. 11-3]
MKIYLLQAPEGRDWDEYQGFVIVAESRTQAREIAGQKAQQYSGTTEFGRRVNEKERAYWLNDADCTLVGEYTGCTLEDPVLLHDYKAG